MKTVRTCSDHYWVISDGQDKNSDLTSINCNKCPIGANISKEYTVKEGKICPA